MCKTLNQRLIKEGTRRPPEFFPARLVSQSEIRGKDSVFYNTL